MLLQTRPSSAMQSIAAFILVAQGVFGSITDLPPIARVRATVGEVSDHPWSVCGPHGCAPVDQICGAWGCANTKDICSTIGCDVTSQATQVSNTTWSQSNVAGGANQQVPLAETQTTKNRLFDLPETLLAPINNQIATCKNPPSQPCICNPKCSLFAVQASALANSSGSASSADVTLEVCGDLGCVSLDQYLASAASGDSEASNGYLKSEL